MKKLLFVWLLYTIILSFIFSAFASCGPSYSQQLAEQADNVKLHYMDSIYDYYDSLYDGNLETGARSIPNTSSGKTPSSAPGTVMSGYIQVLYPTGEIENVQDYRHLHPKINDTVIVREFHYTSSHYNNSIDGVAIFGKYLGKLPEPYGDDSTSIIYKPAVVIKEVVIQ